MRLFLHLQELFMAMDKDDDGRINARDLHQALTQVRVTTKTSKKDASCASQCTYTVCALCADALRQYCKAGGVYCHVQLAVLAVLQVPVCGYTQVEARCAQLNVTGAI